VEKNSSIFNSKIPIALILFLAIYFIGEFFIYKASMVLTNQVRNIVAFNSTTKNTNIDIVAVGHSAVETDINTALLSRMLSEDSGKEIRCFNLGIGNLPIGVTYFVIKNMVLPKKPRLIIFGICWGSELNNWRIQSWDTYHTLPLYTRFGDIPELFRISLLGFDERADFILRKASYAYSYRYIIISGIDLLFRKISEEKGLPLNFLSNRMRDIDKLETMSGFRPASANLNIGFREGVSRLSNKSKDMQPPDNTYYYLDAIIELCKKQDVELVIVALPKMDKSVIRQDTVEYINDNNIPFLDLTTTKKYNAYFFDSNHLNNEGAEIVTRDIEAFLAERTHILSQNPK
jgi:hypothetical protein